MIVEGKLDSVIYTSPAGPIKAMDMLFGHQQAIAQGNQYMAHRSGFTRDYLGKKLLQAGFTEVRIVSGKSYDLWAIACRH